jgi:deoxyribodipyrimidine photo-lyase
MPNDTHILWIKRDARIHDNPALAEAVSRPGRVAALFVFEPAYWRMPEHDGVHFHFLVDGLLELRSRLDAIGIPLIFRTGDAVSVFAGLMAV